MNSAEQKMSQPTARHLVLSRVLSKKILMRLMMLTLAAPLIANANALEQFKAFVANTKGAKGEFSQQQIKLVDGKAKISKTASGTFSFSRPGKFIWTYIKPYEQSLQTDGDKLYIYDKDLNQVTIKDLNGALGASPAAILFGNSDLEKNFHLKDAGTKQGVEWLDATPKAKDSQFEHIGIGMKDGLPMALELRDSFGQISLVTLINVEKNPSFKIDQFKFMLPSGAEVFRQ
ncbi:outer membrane lipoprotein chaperone LolA [Undibacterium sp. Ren11W]|uniref:outer membrane lipoprotein chaperone LolA n=1 Tax=Undibacterium sp. Ren11W TaxID=3413045 RepID=UPI003BF00623